VGWSGYEPRFHVAARVDAHGGEDQDRGERLYAEFVAAIDQAIAAIAGDPKYAEIHPFYDSLDGTLP
jgi:hypothetical protein